MKKSNSKIIVFVLVSLATIACESSEYKKASSLDTVESYNEYLKSYPDGEFVSEAKAAIQRLETEDAIKQNSVSAFTKILSQYPDGEFAAQASDALALHSAAKSVSEITVSAFKSKKENLTALCRKVSNVDIVDEQGWAPLHHLAGIWAIAEKQSRDLEEKSLEAQKEAEETKQRTEKEKKEIKLNRNPKSLTAIDANLQKLDAKVALIDESSAAVGKRVKSTMTGLVAKLRSKLCNEIMSLLLKKGADIKKRTNDNKTPLSIANEHDAKELARFLKQNGA